MDLSYRAGVAKWKHLLPGFVIEENYVPCHGIWGKTKSPDKNTGAFDLFIFFFRVFGFGEFLMEFINTSGGVDELHLTGEERV